MFFDATPQPLWERVPVADCGERYDLGEASNDSVYLEDQFGDVPDYFFVHEGDVTVDGRLILEDDRGEEISTVYVIDGDLVVNGPVAVCSGDSNTSLYVTGSVTVDDLAAVMHGQLFVGGSLVVRGLMMTALADAGHLVVHGSVTAGTWIEVGGRGAIDFAAPPAARLVGSANNPYFDASATSHRPADAMLAEFVHPDGWVHWEQVQRAMLDGRPVLR